MRLGLKLALAFAAIAATSLAMNIATKHVMDAIESRGREWKQADMSSVRDANRMQSALQETMTLAHAANASVDLIELAGLEARSDLLATDFRQRLDHLRDRMVEPDSLRSIETVSEIHGEVDVAIARVVAGRRIELGVGGPDDPQIGADRLAAAIDVGKRLHAAINSLVFSLEESIAARSAASVAELHRIERTSQLTTAGALALVLIITAVIIRQTDRRIQLIREAVHQLAVGNLEARTTVSGRDELAAIAADCNRLAEWMQASQASLEQDHESIEASMAICRAMNQPTESATYAAVLARLAELARCEFAVLFGASDDSLVQMHGVGLDSRVAKAEMFAPDGLATSVFEAGEMRALHGPFTEPNLGVRVGGDIVALETVIGWPLSLGSRPIGVLVTGHVHTPNPRTMTLIRTSLEQLAVRMSSYQSDCLSRAQQEETTERLRQRLNELAEINRRLVLVQAEAVSHAEANRTFLARMSETVHTAVTSLLEDGAAIGTAPIAEREAAVRALEGTGTALCALLDDVVGLARLETGATVIDSQPISPGQSLDAIVDELEQSLRLGGGSLTVTHTSALPPLIETDPRLVGQVIRNLVETAIRWAGEGAVHVGVSAIREPDGWHVMYDMRIAGDGIDLEAIRAVLDPTNTDPSLRCALAELRLATVRRLAQSLGGGVEIVEADGEAHIRCELRADAYVEGAAATDTGGTGVVGTTPLKGRRVLFVEDGLDAQRMVSTVLRRAGATIDIAANGEAGVRVAVEAMESGSPYEVILMDIELPIMDGYTATRRLRQAGFDGPIVALTANGLAEDRRRCLEAGCDDHAMKPMTRQSLLQLVVKSLGGSRRKAA